MTVRIIDPSALLVLYPNCWKKHKQKIIAHLTSTGQIPVNQHGFLPRRSCNTLHMKTINDWPKSLDSN
jgi:hypothetical protein